MKPIISFFVLFPFLMLISAFSFAKTCYNVNIQNRGAYILQVDLPGDLKMGNISAKRDREACLAAGGRVRLKAMAGGSKTFTVNQSGVMKCKGTTLVGFTCNYKKNSTKTGTCYDVKVRNKGAYILRVSLSGDLKMGDITSRRSRSACLPAGSRIRLKARAGGSKTYTVNKKGTITCKGTTLIGFKCRYRS